MVSEPSVAGRFEPIPRTARNGRGLLAAPAVAGCLAGRRSGRLALPLRRTEPRAWRPMVLVGSEQATPSKNNDKTIA